MCRAFNGPRTPGGHFFGRDQDRSSRRVTSDTPLERRPQPEVPSAGHGHDGMANSQAIVAAIGIPSFQRATNFCPACEVDARGPRPARTAAPVTRTGRSSRALGHECIQQHKDKIGLPAAAKSFAFRTSTMSSKLSGPFSISYKVASTSPRRTTAPTPVRRRIGRRVKIAIPGPPVVRRTKHFRPVCQRIPEAKKSIQPRKAGCFRSTSAAACAYLRSAAIFIALT